MTDSAQPMNKDMQQRYMLTIWGLFSMQGTDVCGAQSVVAIMDGETEVDRLYLNGKVEHPDGYSRVYIGKLGLQSRMVSGPGRIALHQIT